MIAVIFLCVGGLGLLALAETVRLVKHHLGWRSERCEGKPSEEFKRWQRENKR